jgi:hypothetical protein
VKATVNIQRIRNDARTVSKLMEKGDSTDLFLNSRWQELSSPDTTLQTIIRLESQTGRKKRDEEAGNEWKTAHLRDGREAAKAEQMIAWRQMEEKERNEKRAADKESERKKNEERHKTQKGQPEYKIHYWNRMMDR